MIIDDTMKLDCLDREVAKRREVYANLVRKGLMSEYMAQREINIMKAVAEDYRNKLQPRLDL